MSTQHTPGRVKLQHPHAGERGWEVAFEPGLEQLCQNITKANARRLVACWNACEGISTENLEDNLPVKELAKRYNAALRQRDALLAALQVMLRDYFAAKALQGATIRGWPTGVSTDDVAKQCYELADVMLRAREAT